MISISQAAQGVLRGVERMPEQSKYPMDVAAVFGGLTALFGLLTGIVGFIAACLSMAWAAIRLYETKTVQEWLKKRRSR